MANIYTSKGEEVVVDAIEAGLACFIGWGTGAGTAAKGDTDLFTPATEARVSATESQPTADKNQWVGTITCSGAGKTITNAGLFDAAGSGSPPSGGNLIVHGDFTGIVLNIGDSIEFTITLEQT